MYLPVTNDGRNRGHISEHDATLVLAAALLRSARRGGAPSMWVNVRHGTNSWSFRAARRQRRSRRGAFGPDRPSPSKAAFRQSATRPPGIPDLCTYGTAAARRADGRDEQPGTKPASKGLRKGHRMSIRRPWQSAFGILATSAMGLGALGFLWRRVRRSTQLRAQRAAPLVPTGFDRSGTTNPATTPARVLGSAQTDAELLQHVTAPAGYGPVPGGYGPASAPAGAHGGSGSFGSEGSGGGPGNDSGPLPRGGGGGGGGG